MVFIDWTISIGNIIQIFTISATALTMFYGMRSDIRVLAGRVKSVEEKQHELNSNFKQLNSILTQVAVQDNRIGMIEKSVDELRHGQGYIKTL